MDEKDKLISALMKELVMWRGRTIEAAQEACMICKAHVHPDSDDCKICRIKKIQEDK